MMQINNLCKHHDNPQISISTMTLVAIRSVPSIPSETNLICADMSEYVTAFNTRNCKIMPGLLLLRSIGMRSSGDHFSLRASAHF